MSSTTVSRVKSACIAICLSNGVRNPKDIRKVMRSARETISTMSVAGVKAAISKGQNVGVYLA